MLSSKLIVIYVCLIGVCALLAHGNHNANDAVADSAISSSSLRDKLVGSLADKLICKIYSFKNKCGKTSCCKKANDKVACRDQCIKCGLTCDV